MSSKATRKPGSTRVPGTVKAPSHIRWQDRVYAVPQGTELNWRKASSRVRGL